MPTVPPSARGAVITGWGTALPDKVLTNDDLRASGLDTSDEWIVERTGIKERRIGGSTASLSVEAGRQAMEMAGLEPSQIDALVLATTTPDRTIPGTSSTVQYQLGLFCGAFDVNAACSGFTYALVVAHGLIAMGSDASSSSAPTRCRASPTGTTATPPCCSPTVPAPSSSKRWRPRPTARLGPRRRRQRRGVPLRRRRRLHQDGRQGGLPARRADHGRLRREVDGRPPASTPTTSPSSSPTRQRGSSRRPATAWASTWTGLPSSSTAPATRRRRRSPRPRRRPRQRPGARRATSSSSSASEPG